MPFKIEEPGSCSKILSHYVDCDSARSMVELLVTAIPFALMWTLVWLALHVGYWLSLILTVPTAGLLVRLFIIQHDCGHGAFFRRRTTNDWVGRMIGIATLTPYAFWRMTHATHHAAVGNLERRGVGDIDTLTVSEFQALKTIRRLAYRVYRNPIVMFGIIPAYLFLLHYRFPFNLMRSGAKPWLSTMGTNLAVAAVVFLWTS